MKRSMAIATLALGIMLPIGCGGGRFGSVSFPYGVSWDRHNYLSTVHQPLSLSLVDTITKETVWSLDIPVGQMAVIDFDHKAHWTPGQPPATPAHQMYWDLFKPGDRLGSLRNKIELSGNPVLLKVDIREPQPSEAEPTTPPEQMDIPTEPIPPIPPRPTGQAEPAPDGADEPAMPEAEPMQPAEPRAPSHEPDEPDSLGADDAP